MLVVLKAILSKLKTHTSVFTLAVVLLCNNAGWAQILETPSGGGYFLFENNDADTGIIKGVIPYRLMKGKSTTSLIYDYDGVKESGYYKLVYKNGKLCTRVLHIIPEYHIFPSYFFGGNTPQYPISKFITDSSIVRCVGDKVFYERNYIDGVLQSKNTYYSYKNKLMRVVHKVEGSTTTYRLRYDSAGRLVNIISQINNRNIIVKDILYEENDPYSSFIDSTFIMDSMYKKVKSIITTNTFVRNTLYISYIEYNLKGSIVNVWSFTRQKQKSGEIEELFCPDTSFQGWIKDIRMGYFIQKPSEATPIKVVYGIPDSHCSEASINPSVKIMTVNQL